MQDLIERLEQLSAAQRQELARQLSGQPDGPRSTRLVAYVVPTAPAALDPIRLRAALAERLPEYMLPHQIAPLPALPLTPNGKVDRLALAGLDLETAPPPAQEYAGPAGETEQTLAGIWSEVLGLELVGVHDNFFEIGGDSILSIQIVARARGKGLALTPALLFQHPTIAELARAIQPEPAGPPAADQGLVTGPVPLTPIQCWFFGHGLTNPQQWNQSLLLRLREPVGEAALLAALRALLEHHDALRARFYRRAGEWAQELAGMPAAIPLEAIDLRGVPPSGQPGQVEEAASRLSRSLRLESGELLRCAHIRYGDTREGLLLVVHHLLVDGISWRLLLEDLDSALDQASQGQPVRLPPKTTSFLEWSRRLEGFVGLPEAAAAQEYWLEDRFRQVQPIPRDFSGSDALNTVETAQVVAAQLEPEETRALLEDTPAAYRTQINDVLLAAFGQALAEWQGQPYACFALEGHGRENLFDGVDITHTAGWFTTVFPVRLELPPAADPGQRLLSVKEQLRALPHNGASHGMLKYAPTYRAAFAELPEPEIVFNYLGQKDAELAGLKRMALESDSLGETRYPTDRRLSLIEVNCFVRGGQFYSNWQYSRCVHTAETVQRLAERFNQALRELVAHCAAPDSGGRSRSDFDLAGLDQESFDLIAGLLDTDEAGG